MIILLSNFTVLLVRALCVSGNRSGEGWPRLPYPLDRAQAQAFLDCAAFSVIAVCIPCDYDLLNDGKARQG
jgi:hypothetical protein